MSDRRILRHLVLAVLLKLGVLVGLWWAFVHDAKVAVDSEAAARHLVAPTAAKQHGAKP